MMDRFLRVEDDFLVSPHRFDDKTHMLFYVFKSLSYVVYGLSPKFYTPEVIR